MLNTLAQSPIQWLDKLEQRAKQRAVGLPHHSIHKSTWRGVAFRLGSCYLVTSLHEIREVLPYPKQLTRVPGAKYWVKGLANIRGLLLPVIDLKACLVNKSTNILGHTRILIINQTGVSAGLLVDEVLGIKNMKNFPEHTRDMDKFCDDWIAPFAKGIFTDEAITWTVFDMQNLAESNLFLNAAI